MGDYGRRDKKNEKGSEHTIEEQIILRVPPTIAEGVRTLLKGKQTSAESDLAFEMHSERKGEMVFEGKKYPVTLVDLPCVIESHKTLDRRTFYKSADVHQMLLVEDPDGGSGEDGDRFKPTFDAEWRLDTGLTRLTRHIRTKRWRRHPSFPRAEVERVAEELSKMKRGAPVPDRYEYVEITEATHAAPAPTPAKIPPTLLVAKPTSSVTLKTTTSSSSAANMSVASSPAVMPSNAIQTPTISTGPKLTVTLPQSQSGTSTPVSLTSSSLLTPATPATPSTPAPVTVGGGIFKFKFGGAKKTATASEETPASTTPATTTASAPGHKLVFASSSQPSTTTPLASQNIVEQTPQTTTQQQTMAQTTPSVTTNTIVPNSNAMAVDVPPTAPTALEQTIAPSVPAPSVNTAEYEAKLAQRAALARQKVSEEAQLAKQLANAQNEKNAMMKKRIQQSATDTQARIKKLDEQIAVLDQVLQAFSV